MIDLMQPPLDNLPPTDPKHGAALDLIPYNLQGSPQFYGVQIRSKLHILIKEANDAVPAVSQNSNQF